MRPRALDIHLGERAAARLAATGWRGSDITTLLGASGGPKWLILGRLDRILFGDFLLEKRTTPLRAIGSSIGSWRHACLAQSAPADTLRRFEDVYVHFEYSVSPDADEVSTASATILEHIFGETGARAVFDNPLVHSYIVTARGRGLNSSRSRAALGMGMGTAAVSNALPRPLLASQFQRVLFASRGAPALPFTDFATQQVPLTPSSVPLALHASGAIPFLLRGERDLPGAPAGHYWDGGIIDYHFDPAGLDDDGLILYPHFRGDLTPGWFDKFLPWRRHRRPAIDNLILLCPSDAFLASLPHGKIPDRSDFRRMAPAQRVAYWKTCLRRSEELAEDFLRQLTSADPLAGTKRLRAASA